MTNNCQGNLIEDYEILDVSDTVYDSYNKHIGSSFNEDTVNWCGFNLLLKHLLAENVVYINVNELDTWYDQKLVKINEALIDAGFEFRSLKNHQDKLVVMDPKFASIYLPNSRLEGHHGKIGYEIYASLIFEVTLEKLGTQ